MKRRDFFEAPWDDGGKDESLTLSLVLITIFLVIVTVIVWCKEAIKKI